MKRIHILITLGFAVALAAGFVGGCMVREATDSDKATAPKTTTADTSVYKTKEYENEMVKLEKRWDKLESKATKDMSNKQELELYSKYIDSVENLSFDVAAIKPPDRYSKAHEQYLEAIELDIETAEHYIDVLGYLEADNDELRIKSYEKFTNTLNKRNKTERKAQRLYIRQGLILRKDYKKKRRPKKFDKTI